MPDLTRFRGMGRGNGGEPQKPTDPEAIFRRAPKRPNSFPDLWRGQTDALRGWNRRRTQPDVLITLNTGAGKTVVGNLIAQSFVNEGRRNVIYACGTIDLIKQTEKEAHRLGLEPTLRTHGAFSDNRFETGDTFCITTYQALYHPFSPFQKTLQPEAVIFDDAHTSEGYLRDAFTFTIEKKRFPAAYDAIIKLAETAFQEINRGESLRGILDDERSGNILLIPPYYVYTRREQITEIVRPLSRGKENEDMRFKWGAISDVFAQPSDRG
jgi:Rad3-related DNA helicase